MSTLILASLISSRIIGVSKRIELPTDAVEVVVPVKASIRIAFRNSWHIVVYNTNGIERLLETIGVVEFFVSSIVYTS